MYGKKKQPFSENSIKKISRYNILGIAYLRALKDKRNTYGIKIQVLEKITLIMHNM